VLVIVLAHLVVAGALPWVARRSRAVAFTVAAVLPALTLVWALVHAGPALDGEVAESVEWVPQLGLTFSMRLDALGLVMVVLVSGLGALILAYSARYFGPGSRDAPRTAALLLAFAGFMLGLVLADDLLTLYVFWELTSIASFLLVGQGGLHRANRRAAVQALLVTVFGGLAMLLGIVLLGHAAGTYVISEIVAAPPVGAAATAGIVLILLGALTKSAQLPFHPWLPAAMAAPTPVSAYLHAASMVKAGVVLVARLSPAFAVRPEWWVPVVVLGLATMLLGGWRALTEPDLKRLLAFGTVSQLGFLMVLFGSGSRIAAYAGIGMLLAHGLFKAPLFMVVGTIDKVTGTRRVDELSGLGRRLPGLAAVATLSAASMAGVPPLLGFVGKEAAFEAFLNEGGPRGWIVDLGLLAGSILTVAYSARFLWGAFASKPGVEPTEAAAPGPVLTVPAWICAVAGLVLGPAAFLPDALATSYAAAYPERSDPVAAGYHLAVWHGLGLPLLESAIALVVGLALHAARHRVGALAGAMTSPVSAQRGYERLVSGLERLATFVTGRLQAGSLPAYLGAILMTMLALPGVALVRAVVAGMLPPLPRYMDTVAQLPLGLAVVLCALALPKVRRRFTAVVLVGAIGYGIGGLFVVDGGPDLALAQFLVETLTLVAFVFVLRRLPAHFDRPRAAPPSRRATAGKAVMAAAAGTMVALTAVLLSAARTAPATASDAYVAQAREGTGADNVVAAILVDFRALDTVGEICVLLIAAAGTASLVLATRFDRRTRRGTVDSGSGTPEHEKEVLG
jgi:multicomponent Na+:H+ antiporter subunit A